MRFMCEKNSSGDYCNGWLLEPREVTKDYPELMQ